MIYKANVWGLVQGVGFRPFVQSLAEKEKITGYVKNKGALVEIVAEGETEALKTFFQRLNFCMTRGAEIWGIEKEEVKTPTHYEKFYIEKSTNRDSRLPLVMPDIATCENCRRELFDKNNRRYGHPFISCTVCGPRYSVLNRLSYDRENTVMSEFELCDSCKAEYNEIENPRSYAQTICCNDCGPKLFYTKAGEPLKCAVSDLQAGKVVAIKDIGGFHFACLANNEGAVENLRLLKLREEKPFAVMFKDIDSIREYATVNDVEAGLLKSDAMPIVLLNKIRDFRGNVSKNSGDIGAMLPSNPVQLMIMSAVSEPLVMTSGNVTNEPIITDNETVLNLEKNSPYLEGVLYHNRGIVTPLDDSVTRVVGGRCQIMRRARGYVPLPIKLPRSAEQNILAMGGDLKSSFCLLKKDFAYMSQHFGDLEDPEVFETYKKNIDHVEKLLNIRHSTVVSDKHPSYFSGGVFDAHIKIQHHKAHVASVIAEHGICGSVLGFAFDGVGYGDDGAVWGGEVFAVRNNEFERVEHLKDVTLFGGDSISKDAKKVLNCYLSEMGLCGDENVNAVLKSGVSTFKSSSFGRLFDAVSALLEIECYNDFEGKCAIALEQVARGAKRSADVSISNWDWRTLFENIIELKKSGESAPAIALGFHNAVAKQILETAKRHGIKNVVLSGGVFANRILTEKSIKLLEGNGFNVYINEKVPTNDGGIALGQAYLSV